MRRWAVLFGVAALAGCGRSPGPACAAGLTAATVTTGAGAHRFCVERARTEAEQAKGLMFRTDIPEDGGMLFAPYPPGGGPPRAATFWMKDTPRPLDIVFIRADGTVARVAENAIPLSETMIASDEPVAAVLELNGARAGELGIAAGDRVSWTPR